MIEVRLRISKYGTGLLRNDYGRSVHSGVCQGRPWIHLDIAGTAWTDNPLYQGQPQGATAAGTSSLYYLLAGGEETCF